MRLSSLRTPVTIKVIDHDIIPSGIYKLKIDDEYEYEEFDERKFLKSFEPPLRTESRFRMASIAVPIRTN